MSLRDTKFDHKWVYKAATEIAKRYASDPWASAIAPIQIIIMQEYVNYLNETEEV